MSASPIQPKIAILLLAAGASSRMGSPKQLLKWGDSTLLNHSINQAVKSKAIDVFVLLGANHKIISKSIENTSISLLVNDDWNQGMGNTISFGVSHIQGLNYDGVLLMLVDQPLIDSTYLNNLIAVFDTSKKSIIASSYHKGAGVPAIFDKSHYPELSALNGDQGAKQLIINYQGNTKIIDAGNLLADIDTDKEYENAKSTFLSK